MSIISKYLIKEILKYVGMVLAVVITIYVAVDFFEKIDDFMEAGLPLSKAISFFIFKIPFIMAQIFPVAILLAVLIVFGLMNKYNEIIALKSGGISIYQLLRPVLLLGICASIFLFFFSEVLVPVTVEKANRIWLRDVKQKRSAIISKEKNIWLKDKQVISHIRYYSKIQKTVFGLTLNYFDENFRLIRRVDAQKGVFKNGKWELHELMEQRLEEGGMDYAVTFHKTQTVPLPMSPQSLETVVKKSEEMNFKELLAYVKKVEDEGYDASTYRVDLYAKTAFPFICVIMCLVGMSISVRAKSGEGLPLGIAYGIGIAFLYWIFYSFCVSLGYGEMLPPVIAAWTANLLFLCFGVLNLLNAE